ncbi:malate dehydrogenase [Achromatium sp. WMS2]|nr:malate dehydrogenase [Achromatium sp. WMS2]
MKRKKIAVVGGAGQIGGIVAMIAAQRELGDVVLVDIPQKTNLTKAKALDITHMLPTENSDVELSGSGDFSVLAGSDVIVVTAGVPRKPGMSRLDLMDINIKIIRDVAAHIKECAPNSFVILTTNPLDAMVYAFHKLSGLTKHKVVGMAGALDSARFKSFLAAEAGVSTEDVACLVMGGHGPTMVPLTRTATAGGVPIEAILSKDRIKAVVEKTRDAGTELVRLYETGSAYFSTAAACIEMVESFLKDKKRVIPSAAMCEGEYGVHGLFLGVPVVIGAGGVERVLEFPLTAEEQLMFNKTIAAVQEAVAESGV